LGEVGKLVRQKKNEELMAAGVTLVDAATTYVDVDATVAPTRSSTRAWSSMARRSSVPHARSARTSACRTPRSAIG
jgi:hypothetical protein